VWYRTYSVRDDLRISYEFAVNEPLQSEWDLRWLKRRKIDPLNPKVLHYARDSKYPNPVMEMLYGHSLLELPRAPHHPEVYPRPSVEPGRLEEHLLRSRILKDERRIWVHVPSGVEPSRPGLHVAVFFDGWGYLHHISAPTILDNLVASHRVAPVLSVFIDQLGFWEKRLPDLCQLSPAFGRFLVQELLPWIEQTHPVRLQPGRTMLVGRSCGGLSALHWASEHPEHFRLVLSQSGFFQGDQPPNEEPGSLIRKMMSRPKLPLQIYMDAGLREGDHVWDGLTVLAANRHMRDVLLLKGYRLCYREFNGGHFPVCWRESLVDGLVELLGVRQRGRQRLE